MRGRGRIGCLGRVAVSVMVVLWASGALAAWVVNERGECVRAWTPASLVRGPAAVLATVRRRCATPATRVVLSLRSCNGGGRPVTDAERAGREHAGSALCSRTSSPLASPLASPGAGAAACAEAGKVPRRRAAPGSARPPFALPNAHKQVPPQSSEAGR